MLWTMPFTYPLLVAIQMISARIGRVTGHGLAAQYGAGLPRSVVTFSSRCSSSLPSTSAQTLPPWGGAGWCSVGASIFTLGTVLLVLQMFVPYLLCPPEVDDAALFAVV
jgi:hypothetical protein